MTAQEKKGVSHVGLLAQSILNGLVGDYLEQTNNPLAIPMCLCHDLKPLNVDAELGRQLHGVKVSNKVVVLVHGLTNLETVWDYPTQAKPEARTAKAEESSTSAASARDLSRHENPTNYGIELQRALGFTPLFLRYNTGLSIAENGRQFSEILARLFAQYPMKIDELVLLGFSMGGLLLRYAQMDATATEKGWLSVLSTCVYIGTPHEGSPVEKLGYMVGEVVRNIPVEHVNHWAEWIDIRSRGIKDLKFGMKHASGNDQNDECASYYKAAKHCFISGSVGRARGGLAGQLFGDSLVRERSASPRSKPVESESVHFENLSHIPLAHSDNVYRQIEKWVRVRSDKIALEHLQGDNSAGTRAPTDEGVDRNKLSGALDLASDTAYKIIDTTQTLHQSIARLPFGILNSIPLLDAFSAPVESLHKGVSDKVYSTLKKTTKKARGTDPFRL